ncbi:hypothetical protein VKT23_014513 [Stygiomarasmius scandens]|uniref:Trafficking protein particle complex II-specific subunit 65 IgD3 domain-containing protein n=1 Tax=Marasmiellus scandens TaxID=2682957 RepID=A0ABR1J1H1_9AGAR
MNMSMTTFEELFTSTQLDVCAPNASLQFPGPDTVDVDKWLEELEQSDRSQAFFDEHLQTILTVRLPETNSSSPTTPTSASSPKPNSQILRFLSHLQIALEASYIPRAPVIEGGRIEESSSSKELELPPSPRPLTPTPRSPRPSSVPLSASASTPELSLPPRHASLKKPVNLSLSPNSLAPPGGNKKPPQIHHPSILPPATPNPTPASTASDARYALPGAAEQGIVFVGGPAGGVIWGQAVDSGENTENLKKGLDEEKESFCLLWSPRERVWVAIYRMVLDVAFLRLPFTSPLLCLTVSTTLRDKPTTNLEKHLESLGMLPSPYPVSPSADNGSSANEGENQDTNLQSQFNLGSHPILPQILPLQGPPEANLLGGLFGISGFQVSSSPVDAQGAPLNPFTGSPTTATSAAGRGSRTNSPASATFANGGDKATLKDQRDSKAGKAKQTLSLPSTRLGPATRVDLFCLPAEPGSPSPSATSTTFPHHNANASTVTLTSAPPKSPRSHRPTSTQDKRELARALMGGSSSGRSTPSGSMSGTASVDNSRPGTPSTMTTSTAATSVSAPGTPTTSTTPGTGSTTTARLGTPLTGTAGAGAILTLKKSFRKTLGMRTGFKVRMRTVFVPSVVFPSESELAGVEEDSDSESGSEDEAEDEAKAETEEDAQSEDEEEDKEDLLASGSSERTVVLCVEVENESFGDGSDGMPASFVIERVEVDVGSGSSGIKTGGGKGHGHNWGESGARTRLIGWDDISFDGSGSASTKKSKLKAKSKPTTTDSPANRPKLRIHSFSSQRRDKTKSNTKHFPLLLAPNEQHNLLYAVSFLRSPEEEAAESLVGLTGTLGATSAVAGAPQTLGSAGAGAGFVSGAGDLAKLQRSVTINIFGRPCFKTLKSTEEKGETTPLSASSSSTDIMNIDDTNASESITTPKPSPSSVVEGETETVTMTKIRQETLLFPTSTFSTKWNCLLDLSSSFTQPPYRTSQSQPPPVMLSKPQFNLPFGDDEGLTAESASVLPEPPSPFPVSVSGNFPTSASFRSSGLASPPVTGGPGSGRDRRSLGTDIGMSVSASVGGGKRFSLGPGVETKRHTLPNLHAPGFPQRPGGGNAGVGGAPRARASLTPSLPAVPSGQVNSIPFGSGGEEFPRDRERRESSTPSLRGDRERRDSAPSVGSKLRERRDSLLSLMSASGTKDSGLPVRPPSRTNTRSPAQHYYTPPSVTQSQFQSSLRSPTTYEPPPLPDKDFIGGAIGSSAPGAPVAQSIDHIMGIGEVDYPANATGLGVNVGLPPMTPAYPAFPGNITGASSSSSSLTLASQHPPLPSQQQNPSFPVAIPPTPPSQAPLIPQGGNFGGPTAGAYSSSYTGQSVDVKRERGMVGGGMFGMGVGALPTPTPRPVVGIEGGYDGYEYEEEKGMVMNEGESIIISVGLLNRSSADEEDKKARRQQRKVDSNIDSSSSESELDAEPNADNTPSSHSPELIYPLDTFTLDIFVFNRSSWTRRFEITCPDSRVRRKRLEREMIMGLQQNLNPNQKGFKKNTKRSGAATVAALMAMEKEKTRGPGVLPLENRVRIGPLLPSACQSVRMKFLAVSPGVHAIDTLTLTDIESGFSMNLRSVMDVVVHEH